MAPIASSDAMLVVGSSLMIYPGYRFVTADSGNRSRAINIGPNASGRSARAKIEDRCANALRALSI